MRQNLYKITASNRFQAVIQFLRKELGWKAGDPLVRIRVATTVQGVETYGMNFPSLHTLIWPLPPRRMTLCQICSRYVLLPRTMKYINTLSPAVICDRGPSNSQL